MPTLQDDGSTVTVDLHGCRVDEAADLAVAAVAEAARRGRATVRLIHGSSTSGGPGRARTIKHALHDLVDRHALGAAVVDAVRTTDTLLLSLGVKDRSDPTPLRLREVWP